MTTATARAAEIFTRIDFLTDPAWDGNCDNKEIRSLALELKNIMGVNEMTSWVAHYEAMKPRTPKAFFKKMGW